MNAVPLTLQTLYADLVQQAHAGLPDLGSIYVQTQKGAEYLYANRTVGVTRRHWFIGRADHPEAQAKAEAIRKGSKRAAERRNTVRILRSQGLPAPSAEFGRVLDALADAGLFRDAVLVGTAAYQCYSALAGVFLPSAALMTQDADLATASLAISADEPGDTMHTILKRADPTFAALPGLKPQAPPSNFRSASGFVVDLLIPQRTRNDLNPMPLKALTAGAAPLQHLRWLMENPVHAVALHGPGIPVRVPAPARYATHKLIVAQKRGGGDAGKRQKDLVQAKALIEALQKSDPWAIRDAVDDAKSQGKEGWARLIDRSLKELNLDAALLAER
ncbi:MAG: hypothetical protein H0T75_24565 [Rhizobiales bacterium]|nr:hypothetical protein [Hyphomicrobiales bacterium]